MVGRNLEISDVIYELLMIQPRASELCDPCAKPHRWAPPLVTRFGVITSIMKSSFFCFFLDNTANLTSSKVNQNELFCLFENNNKSDIYEY